MNIIDPDNPIPKYLQISAWIKDLIQSGRYEKGGTLAVGGGTGQDLSGEQEYPEAGHFGIDGGGSAAEGKGTRNLRLCRDPSGDHAQAQEHFQFQ